MMIKPGSLLHELKSVNTPIFFFCKSLKRELPFTTNFHFKSISEFYGSHSSQLSQPYDKHDSIKQEVL